MPTDEPQQADLRTLADAEERLRSVVNHVVDGIISTDENGMVTTFNPAAERIFGCTAQEIIGRNIKQLMPEPYHSQHDDYIANYLRTGQAKILGIGREVVGRRKDGSTFPMDLAISEFRLGQGRGFTGIVRDIAERKQAEDLLRREREFIRLVLDTDPNLIFVKDAAGRFVLVNKALADLYGTTPQALVGRTAGEDVAAPRELDDYRRVEQEVLRTRRAVTLGESNTRPDGRVYWFHTVKAPLVLPDGTAHVLGIAADVTEQKRAEEAMRQAQQRLRDVVASSPAVLFTLALDGERIQGISWISDNLQEMLGYTAEEALGPDWWLANIHPEDRDRLIAHTREQLFTRGRTAHEYRFRRQNGQYRWTRVEIRLIRDDGGGRLPAAVGSWSDVTERKQIEEQLRQAQKMEAIGQLAGGVAHDFNNLLTIINGYSDIVQTQLPADSPVRASVREIGQAGERAASLTRQLLAFSRKQVLEPKVLNLNAIVTDTTKMLQRLIGEDVDLDAILGPGLGRVRADPGQIEQVLINLAVNARDAMPKGGKLTIETANVELDETYAQAHADVRPGRYVLLAMTDTGCGMDEATKARIFEPFFTTKGPGKGTGLGLAMVYGVVKQSEGHLAVYSEPEHGTTFKIYLPVIEKIPSSGKSQPGLKLAQQGNETILLAEDEPAVRVLTRHVLQMHGYTVLEASQGENALRIAEACKDTIHLLVTDVVMPVMSGRQLAERLTAVRPGVKVLYLSGYTDDAVVRHGVLEAEAAFLQKPFTPAGLAQKVREVLDR